MKRLFLLIAVCMIGMVVPQGMWAETYTANGVTIVVEGKTVTINSTNAGALSSYLNSGNASAAIAAIQAAKGDGSSIVFNDKFNADDLNALRDKSCCVQETVNMANTTFIKSVQPNDAYKIRVQPHNVDNKTQDEINAAFNSAASGVGPQEGDVAVAGNKFYQLTNGNWVLTTNPCFASLERLQTCMDSNNAYDKYAMAMVDGKPTVFKYANNPATNRNEWFAVSSYEDVKFSYWGSNVKKAISSYNAGSDLIATDLCNGCSNLKDLTIGSGTVHSITHNANGNTPPLTDLTIGNKVAKLGNGNDGVFADYSSITNLTFETGGNDPLVIDKNSFIRCGITSVSFPARTSTIEENAFSECNSLKTVKFLYDTQNTNPLVIKSKAFQNSKKIKDVDIAVNSNEKLLICEYNAFSFDAMEAQTQVDGEMATLHFPEDTNDHPDNFDFYAGEWKKGMAFSQNELNSFKDGLQVTVGGKNYVGDNIVQDPRNFDFDGQDQGYTAIWKYDNIDGYYHPSEYPNTKYAPANGWQQFAKTDSKREIYITGNVYMTYSTNKPYSLPTGIIAFRVTDYVDAGTAENGKTKNGKLVLKMIDQVPTETGMLLISTNKYKVTASQVALNPNIQSMFYFGDAKGTPTKYHYKMIKEDDPEGTSDYNYLAPAVHGITVGPVSKGEPDAKTGAIKVDERPFTHRNFILRKSDHWFVRTTPGTMPDNRAFLSLPIEKFTNDNESDMEGPLPWNTKAGDAFSTYDETSTEPGSNAKTNLFFEYDVEEYGMIWPLAMMNSDMGITTSISSIQQEKANNGIFTLQGVKVSAPSTKGIYIVNGKKVIIK